LGGCAVSVPATADVTEINETFAGEVCGVFGDALAALIENMPREVFEAIRPFHGDGVHLHPVSIMAEMARISERSTRKISF
jgi:hypothetical protein